MSRRASGLAAVVGVLGIALLALSAPAAVAISQGRVEAETLESFCVLGGFAEAGDGKASGDRWLKSAFDGATCAYDFDVPTDFVGFLVAGAWVNSEPGSVSATVNGETIAFTPGAGKGLYSMRFGPLPPGTYTATLLADKDLGFDFIDTELELASVSISNSGDISVTSAESSGFLAVQLLASITMGVATGYMLWGRSS